MMVGLLVFIYYDNNEVSMLGQLIASDGFRRVFSLNGVGGYIYICSIPVGKIFAWPRGYHVCQWDVPLVK